MDDEYGDIVRTWLTPWFFQYQPVLDHPVHDQYCLFVTWGYAANKDADKTLEWLELAFQNGFTNYPFLADYDPHLRFLDDDPRFQDFLKRVKETWEDLKI